MDLNWLPDADSTDDEFEELVMIPPLMQFVRPIDFNSSEDEEHTPDSNSNDDAAEDNIWNSNFVRIKCMSLYSKVNEYFATGEYTDVNIKCEDRVFKCHRIVLASTSEYFHLMFSGGFRECTDKDVVLHDFDSTTFEQILRHIYTGDVGVIDTENVYNLLRACDLLRLPDLESRCINYLLQCQIPVDNALEIFSLAHLTRKEPLIPVLSRFILAHLNHFCADESFMKLSLNELNTMVYYSSFLSSCKANEQTLLNVILRWALHLTGTHADRKNSFLELTGNIKFKHISATYIADYYDRSTTACDNKIGDGDALTIDDMNYVMHNIGPSLTLYVNGYDPVLEKYETYQSRLEKQDSALSWSPSHVIESTISKMRTVALDEQLYCLKSHKGELTFDVCTLANLCPVASLRAPQPSEHYSGLPYFMCHDDETIYFLHWNHKVLAYNRVINNWSPIPVFHRRFFPTMMTCYDRRLFLIGSKPFEHPHRHRVRSTSNVLVAYDPRDGKLERLASCKNPHSLYDDECCCHNERIYVTYGEKRETFMMDVYDPRAGKWDVIFRKAKRPHNFSFAHRLLSFDHRLWLFYSDSSDSISYETYDSFLQDWGAETPLNHIFENRKYPRIMDAAVF